MNFTLSPEKKKKMMFLNIQFVEGEIIIQNLFVEITSIPLIINFSGDSKDFFSKQI